MYDRKFYCFGWHAFRRFVFYGLKVWLTCFCVFGGLLIKIGFLIIADWIYNARFNGKLCVYVHVQISVCVCNFAQTVSMFCINCVTIAKIFSWLIALWTLQCTVMLNVIRATTWFVPGCLGSRTLVGTTSSSGRYVFVVKRLSQQITQCCRV